MAAFSVTKKLMTPGDIVFMQSLMMQVLRVLIDFCAFVFSWSVLSGMD